jgi:membrane-associated protease RseP (regulator of RpoE activity)
MATSERLSAEMDDIPQTESQPVPSPLPRRRVGVPVLLFVLTCISTWYTGAAGGSAAEGFAYAGALMTTLLAHELGHFFQAMRYGVPASLPYFIPIPRSPIGTMGAVIFMRPGIGDRRALFDIGITGPLAGLVPAVIFSTLGLYWSHVVVIHDHSGLELGEPLIFKFIARCIFGPLPANQDIALNPVAYAGWVGIFITALNLFPIGQLDGGHVLYALLRRRAHLVAQTLLVAAIIAVIFFGYWTWSLMLLLLMLMGPNHPPTANDYVPLGPARTILGCLALLFVIIGFTPTPFVFGSN